MRKLGRSLDRRDRLMLAISLGFVVLLILIVAVATPVEDDSNPTPSSYSAQANGAKAAYLLLQRSGYRVERWTRPLSSLAAQADEHTVVVLAEPYFFNVAAAREAVQQILARGGRVLATGLTGGMMLPENEVRPFPRIPAPECNLAANGFGAIAGSGDVRLAPQATWRQINPRHHTEFTCNGNAAVVSYRFGKGQAIWWAGSQPLQNSGIATADNLSLLLASVGSPAEARVVWDESLHGDVEEAGLWSYARGTPLPWVWLQLALGAALLIFSFSRRSGPLRPDPVASRATPTEFAQSLGALYHEAGAAGAALSTLYQRFRFRLEEQLGIAHSGQTDPGQLARAAAVRFGYDPAGLERDLTACEAAARGGAIPEKLALALAQALHDYEIRLQHHLPANHSAGGSFGRARTNSQ